MALYLGRNEIDAYGGQPVEQDAVLVSLTVTPTDEPQTLLPSGNIDGWNRISVNPIPSSYIIPSGTMSIISNGTYNVKSFVSATVSVPDREVVLQSKSVIPSELSQIISADSGYDGLSEVNVSAISSSYVGSGIERKEETDVLVDGSIITVPNGYYSNTISKSITTVVHSTPSISLNAVNGTITATHTQLSGYVIGDTTSSVLSLTTQSANTITPSELSQVAVSSNTYVLGDINVAAISSTYVGTGVSRRNEDDLIVSGAIVTTPAGYYSSTVTKGVSTVAHTLPTISFDSDTGVVTAIHTQETAYIIGGTAQTTLSLPIQSAITVTPAESMQTVSSHVYLTGDVTVASISSDYVGTNVERKSDSDLTTSNETVVVPSGYYSSQVSKSIDIGTATVPATTIVENPTISIDSTTGIISANYVGSSSITPIIVPGYISSGVSGIVSINGSSILSLPTQSSITITPTSSQQVIVDAGKYTIGSVIVSPVPTESKTITVNGDFYPTEGKFLNKVTVNVDTVKNQNKTITPLEEEQEVKADEGYTGLGTVLVNAISSDYVGSNIPKNSSEDVVVNEDTITIPSGYFSSQISSSVRTGEAITPATTIITNPSITFESSTGKIIASYAGTSNVTPTITSGWITTGRSGVITTSGSSEYTLGIKSASDVIVSAQSITVTSGYYSSAITKAVATTSHVNPTLAFTSSTGTIVATHVQEEGYVLGSTKTSGITLATKSAETIVPTETEQIISSNQWLVGNQTIAAISSTYVGTGISKVSSANVIVNGSTVTSPIGYYSSSITKTVESGSATTPSTTITVNPTITLNSSGIITASYSGNSYITPTIVEGYISQGISGLVSIGGTSTFSLTTASARTITPTESNQLAVDSNIYTLGKIEVAPISSTYVGSAIPKNTSESVLVSGSTITTPIGYYASEVSKTVAEGQEGIPVAIKGTVSSNSINITPKVENTEGYILGGEHLGTPITVSASELVSGTLNVTANGIKDVTNYASVNVNINTVNNQDKDVVPTESEQEIIADEGYTGLGKVTVSAISSTYVGSGIPKKSSADIIVSGSTITTPIGYYSSQAVTSISVGTATTPSTTFTIEPSLTINSSTGVITTSFNSSRSITPTVVSGYISSGISGIISVSGSGSLSLATKSATTITPIESVQTAVSKNVYTIGDISIGAISSTYVGTGVVRNTSTDLIVNGSVITVPSGFYSDAVSKAVSAGTVGVPVANKGTVSSNSITITPTVTNTTGYITGSTLTGSSITVNASELVSGTFSITSNGTYDIINYSSVTVDIPTGIDGDNLAYGNNTVPMVNVAALDFVIPEGDENSSLVGTGLAGFSIVGE